MSDMAVGVIAGLISGTIVAVVQGVISSFINYLTNLNNLKNYVYKLCRTIDYNSNNVSAIVEVLAEEPKRIRGLCSNTKNTLKELYNIIDAIDCSIGEDTDIMDLSSERDKMEAIRHKL